MQHISARDWALLARVAFLQLTIAIALRIVRWAALRRMMPALCTVGRRFVSAPERRVVWALEATGRRLSAVSTCLVRALAAEMLLGSDDRPLRVTIGIRRAGERLESHAWVERDGRVIVGEVAHGVAEPDASFVPLLTWESPGV